MQHLYSIYDRVSREFGPPWMAKNDDVAQRQFYRLIAETAKREDKDDFELYLLGSFNEEDGNIICNKLFLSAGKQIVFPEKRIDANMSQVLPFKKGDEK